MKRLFGVLIAISFLWSSVPAQVQLRVPRISQGAKISQAVGLSEISITYSRPGVKGREIWGKLVPYAQVWRAGANEPTLITFSDEVTIGGKKLPAGTYRFLVLPVQTGDWTLIFNSEIKNWGTVYEAQYDTLKVPVKPMEGPFEEWMSFSFTDLTQTSVRVVLAWEKVRVSFVAEFNTLAKVEASVGTWQLLNSAARFALDNKIYAEQGMAWVDRSIAMNRDPRNLQTKAQLLAQAGKYAEAIKLAEEAMTMARAKDPKANTSALEAMVAEWKTKK
jgi:hypothetical protein